MTGTATAQVEEVLNSFAEIMSRLLIERYQRHLAELDLTLLQAQVLRALRHGSLLTGQLASELRISAPALTQLTDRLVRKGLIERQAAVDDRRCVLVTLSAKGRRLVDQFRRQRSDIFNGALAYLSEVEQAQVVKGLRKAIEALESYESQQGNARERREAGSESKKRIAQ
jgi:DNA-binding MarR family transcriptional regulator